MKPKHQSMKALFWPVCCAGLLSLCSCGPRVARVESVDIVPRPVTVEASDGAFDLTRSTKICLLSDDTMLLRSADFFNGLLQPSLGRALKVETGACADSDAIRVELGDLAPEAYEISIRPEGVRIVRGQSRRRLICVPDDTPAVARARAPGRESRRCRAACRRNRRSALFRLPRRYARRGPALFLGGRRQGVHRPFWPCTRSIASTGT